MSPRITRLFRISLRGFLVVVTVLCVLVGIEVRKMHRQQRAIAWVEEHGGSVWYNYEFEDMLAVMLGEAKPPGPKWLHQTIGEDYFRSPVCVMVQNDTLIDVSPLAELSDLAIVEIESCQLRDFSPLTKLKKLESIILLTLPADTEITRLRKAMPKCGVEWRHWRGGLAKRPIY